MEDTRRIPRKYERRLIDAASPLWEVDGKGRPHSNFSTASDFHADSTFDQQDEALASN